MDRLSFWLKLAVGGATAVWGGLTPMIQLLLILMVADVVTGFLAGFVTKQLSSDVSWAGMAKKTIILIIVAVASYAEPTVGIPLSLVVTGFYCTHEFLSILENAGKSGLEYPAILKDALKKLNSGI